MGLFDMFTGKVTPDQFAQKMIKVFQQAGIQGDITYDAQEFCLRFPAMGGDQRSFLHNVYKDYTNAARGDRDGILQRHAQAMLTTQNELPSSFNAARPHIMPIVRNSADSMAARAKVDLPLEQLDEDGAQLFQAAPDGEQHDVDWLVQLAFDSEHAMRRLSGSDLEKWGVNFEQAMAQAVDNLRKLPQDRWDTITPGVYISQFRDSYDSSRVLIPDCLYRLQLSGQPVVMLPTRDCMLVTGSRDPQAHLTLVHAAGEIIKQQSRFLSAQMLMHDGNGWVQFLPQGEAGIQLRSLQTQMISGDYADQKEYLEKQLEQEGKDVFVASHKLFRKGEDQPIQSYAVWTKGVDTLLPQAEVIVFVLPGETEEQTQTVMVPWKQAHAVIGHLMSKTSHVPVRYEVSEFPTDEEYAQLSQLTI